MEYQNIASNEIRTAQLDTAGTSTFLILRRPRCTWLAALGTWGVLPVSRSEMSQAALPKSRWPQEAEIPLVHRNCEALGDNALDLRQLHWFLISFTSCEIFSQV